MEISHSRLKPNAENIGQCQTNYNTINLKQQFPRASSTPGFQNQNPATEAQDNMLDLVNKVQMFQIAVNKINNQMQLQGKKPVFSLASQLSNWIWPFKTELNILW